MTIYAQCLGQDKETMKFVWQVINKDKCTLVKTKWGSITDIPYTFFKLNTTIKELPNHFVHFAGEIKQI